MYINVVLMKGIAMSIARNIAYAFDMLVTNELLLTHKTKNKKEKKRINS